MIHDAWRNCVQSVSVERIWGNATAVTMSSTPTRKTPRPSAARTTNLALRDIANEYPPRY